MTQRVLLADHTPEASALARRLGDAGYAVEVVGRGEDALRKADESAPHLAMVAMGLPGKPDAVDAAAVIGEINVPVVFLVDDDDVPQERADEVRPQGYLVRPVDDRQLALTIRAALKAPRRFRDPRSRNRLVDIQELHHIRLTETIFHSISDGIVVTDVNGKLLYANPSAVRIVGRTLDGPFMDWRTHYEFFRVDKKTPFPFRELPATLAGRGTATDDVEIFLRHRGDSEGVFISVHGRPLRDEDGAVVGGITVIRDITGLKAAEAKLQEAVVDSESQKDLMTTIIESISDGLVVVDKHGDYLIFNPSAKRIMGKHVEDARLEQRSEAYGMYLPDKRTPYPVEELPLTRALNNESTDDVEVFVRNEERPDGATISVSGRPLRDRTGATTGGTIMFKDITQTKEAQNRIEEANQRLHRQTQTLEAVLDSIGDGVLVFDTEGKLIFNNPSANRIVGDGMLAKTDASRWQEGHGIFLRDEKTRFPEEDYPQRLAVRGKPSYDVKQFIRNPKIPNGVHLSIDARPMYERSGELSGAVLIARDETTRYRSHQAVNDAFAHGRLEVLDTIVHNIGNAINSVSTGVGTVRDRVAAKSLLRRLRALADAMAAHRDDLPTYLAVHDQGKQVVPFILALADDFEHQNERLVQTIERVAARVAHIVEIVRTQTSQYNGSVARTYVHLKTSIDQAANILRESLASRDIELAIDCARAPHHVVVQESNLHQLIVNLVTNSIDAIDERREAEEATAPGCIGIESYVDGGELVIEVRDNGIGMDRSQLESVFFPGYTTKAEGTGLGLHSAANYVISSGGTITPSSEGLGKGAKMRIAWPLSTVAEAARSTARAGAGTSARSGTSPGTGA